jgi:hypothetical protein
MRYLVACLVTLVSACLVLACGARVCTASDLTFVLNAEVACCASGEHIFGWLDGSSTGIDPADVPEPPLPLGPYMSAFFHMPGVTDPDRWRRDLRASADFAVDGRESWDIEFVASSLPAMCTVTVAPGSGDPAGLALIFGGAYTDTTAIPATVTFPLGSSTRLTIDVLEGALPAASTSWGDLKCLYK